MTLTPNEDKVLLQEKTKRPRGRPRAELTDEERILRKRNYEK